jgi:hypothetical protein
MPEEPPTLSLKERVKIGIEKFPMPVGYYINGQLMQEPNKEKPFYWSKMATIDLLGCFFLLSLIWIFTLSPTSELIETNFRAYSKSYTPNNFMLVVIDSGTCESIEISIGENYFKLEDNSKKCTYSFEKEMLGDIYKNIETNPL